LSPRTSKVSGEATLQLKTSCLDHIYIAGSTAECILLPDATTDHYPLLATINVSNKQRPPLVSFCRRNFKSVSSQMLESALDLWDWSIIYTLQDVETNYEYLIKGITAALDMVAPFRSFKACPRTNLYLSHKTKAMMRARVSATSSTQYRFLRNKVTSLLRRDKLRSNLDKLKAANGNPKTLWELANQTIGNSK